MMMMMMIHRFAIIAVVLLGCSLLVQSFSYSSRSSSKRSSNNNIMKPQQQLYQQRQACSYLFAALSNSNSNSNEQERSVVTFQKVFAACFVTASLWMSPVVLEQNSHNYFPTMTMTIHSSQAASAKELIASGSGSRDGINDRRTAAYERSVDLFVGGYTVKGTKLEIRPGKAPGAPEGFRVAQECICSATATEHGIFATGANPDNAFLFVATLNDKGDEWTAEQTSTGATPPYKATMRFGATAGGPHTAIGSTLARSGGGVTAFSAEQSAMGCTAGEGAATCKTVCGKHGLSWEMIKRKCGL